MQYREGIPESTVRFYNHRRCEWETITLEPLAVITAVTERDYRSDTTPLSDFHERVREQDHLFTLLAQERAVSYGSCFGCSCGLQIVSSDRHYRFAQGVS